MLKHPYSNGTNHMAALRSRPTRQVLGWMLVILLTGSLWHVLSNSRSESKPGFQSTVYVHKSEGEIDVLSWPEERWFEGPRNDTQLEKAALIMLVRCYS
jgi:hypothetical protein